MLKTSRSRIVALIVSAVLVLAGILVPVAANAAVAYPAQAPGTIALDQVGTSQISYHLAGDFPSGATAAAKVQWYRGTTAITGATSSVYTLTSADQNKLIKVRVTVSVPGFAPTARYSTAGNFTFTRYTGALTIGGVGQVGASLTPHDDMTFRDPSGNDQFPDRSYQWLVNGVATGPATFGTIDPFLLTAAHYGKKVTLRAVITNFGIAPQALTSNAITVSMLPAIGIGATTVLVTKNINPDHSLTLRAETGGDPLPTGVAVAYTWYRQNYATFAITSTRKTGSAYKLSAADYPYRIFARATFTKAGKQPFVIDSYHADYSLRVENLGIFPAPRVGIPSNSNFDYSYENPGTFDMNDRTYTPGAATIVRQWLRNGVVIPGGAVEYYTPVAADLGKQLSFRVTGSLLGFLSPNLVSPKAAKTVAGALDFSAASPPSFAISPTLKLTVTPGLPPSPGATVSKYQWTRNGVAIPGAMSASFQLAQSDSGKDIGVLITFSRPGYASGTMTSQPVRYYVQPSVATPAFTGQPTVGQSLTMVPRSYTNAETGATISSPEVSPQWLRNGVAIPGATSAQYVLQEIDKGKTISLRVTAGLAGQLLSNVSTSAATPPIGDQLLAGDYDSSLTISHGGTPTVPVVTVGGIGITEPGATSTYQWFRSGVAIPGATKASYALTSADRLKLIHVRVTTTHAPVAGQAFTPSIKTSVPADYSIAVTSGITGNFYLGGEIYYDHTQKIGSVPLTIGYNYTNQWLRNGVAIPGANAVAYTLTSADVGKRISVRATFWLSGYLPITVVTGQTQVIAAGTFDLGGVVPEITPAGPGKLKVTVPTGIVPAPSSYGYQWLRNGTPIPGATASTYTLVAADKSATVTVRVTARLAYFTNANLTLPDGGDYALTPSGVREIVVSGDLHVGEIIHSTAIAYSTDATGPISVTPAYQWLRNGVAIAGAISADYAIAAADLNTSLSLRVTATAPGALAHTATTSGTYPVKQGTTTVMPDAIVTFDDATQTLRASITGMVPETPAPALTYQWMRNGSDIPKATSATYKPIAVDVTADLSVRITVNRGAAFTNTIAPVVSASKNYRIIRGTGPSDAPVVITGDATVGETLSVAPSGYVNGAGNPIAYSESFAWYRSGTPIPGATGNAYVLQAADQGKAITARVTAKASGYLTNVSALSAPTASVGVGTIVGTFDAAITSPSPGVLTATLVPGPGSTPGVTAVTYAWYRGNVGPKLSSAQNYKLVAADDGLPVYVRISVGKPGFTTKVDEVQKIANLLAPQTDPVITGGGGVLHVSSDATFAGPGVSSYTREYDWRRDGSSINGWGPDSFVVLTPDDVGHTFELRVRGVVTGYYSGFATSNAITP